MYYGHLQSIFIPDVGYIVLLELDGDSIIYQYKKKMWVAQLSGQSPLPTQRWGGVWALKESWAFSTKS